ncbi:MAG: hypothetical protein FJX71_05690 [Alphaproteobacteria bacterium]|nr:hypothetical protein [Alphaproteobacteria bacterium]
MYIKVIFLLTILFLIFANQTTPTLATISTLDDEVTVNEAKKAWSQMTDEKQATQEEGMLTLKENELNPSPLSQMKLMDDTEKFLDQGNIFWGNQLFPVLLNVLQEDMLAADLARKLQFSEGIEPSSDVGILAKVEKFLEELAPFYNDVYRAPLD